jgi:hypothetical protein
MFARISEAKVLDHYKVFLRFEDGVQGEADFSDFAGKGVFASWNDYKNFCEVDITHKGRVLEWKGELDFCADSLYLQLTTKV